MGARRGRTTALIGATAMLATVVLAGCESGADKTGSSQADSGAVAPANGGGTEQRQVDKDAKAAPEPA